MAAVNPPRKINNPAITPTDLFKILKAADSCHDVMFKKNRGPENVDIQLDKALKSKIGIDDHDNFLDEYFNTYTGSFEEPATKFIENNTTFLKPIGNNIVVLKDGDNTANELALENYINADSLDIVFPESKKKDKNNTKVTIVNDYTYIGKFIRRFMIGEGGGDILEFVVDSNAGKLPKCFEKDVNVYVCLNALVVGDSATSGKGEEVVDTDKATLKKITPSIFPNKDGGAGKARYNICPLKPDARHTQPDPEDYPSLFFSEGFIQEMYYEETIPGEFENNFHALKLVVKYKDSPKPFELEFTNTTNSGASINTLKTLIRIINESTPANVKNNIEKMEQPPRELEISSLVIDMIKNRAVLEDITSFLIDYKRTGDYEQVKSALWLSQNADAKFILSTGDCLCSTYARFLKTNCIYNHPRTMTLYRSQERGVNIEQYIKICTAKVAFYNTYLKFYLTYGIDVHNEFKEEYNKNVKEFITDRLLTKPIDDKTLELFEPLVTLSFNGYENDFNNNIKNIDKTIEIVLSDIVNQYKTDINTLNSAVKTVKLDVYLLTNAPLNTYKIADIANKENEIKDFLANIQILINKLALNKNKTVTIVLKEEAVNLTQNNIFNYDFTSHLSFIELYETLINKTADEKEKEANKKLDEMIEKTRTDYNTPLPPKSNPRGVPQKHEIYNKEKKISDLKKIKKTYITGILDKIEAIDSKFTEIIKTYNEKNVNAIVLEKFDTDKYKPETFTVANIDNKTKIIGSRKEIIEAYNDSLKKNVNIIKGIPGFRMLEINQPPAPMATGGGEEEEEEEKLAEKELAEIILSKTIDDILLTFSENIKSLYTGIEFDYKKDNTDPAISIKQYIETLYKESLKWYSVENYDIKKSFKIGGKTFTTNKCNYKLFLYELISDLNVELLKLVTPDLSIESIKELIETKIRDVDKLLLNDNETEADAAAYFYNIIDFFAIKDFTILPTDDNETIQYLREKNTVKAGEIKEFEIAFKRTVMLVFKAIHWKRKAHEHQGVETIMEEVEEEELEGANAVAAVAAMEVEGEGSNEAAMEEVEGADNKRKRPPGSYGQEGGTLEEEEEEEFDNDIALIIKENRKEYGIVELQQLIRSEIHELKEKEDILEKISSFETDKENIMAIAATLPKFVDVAQSMLRAKNSGKFWLRSARTLSGKRKSLKEREGEQSIIDEEEAVHKRLEQRKSKLRESYQNRIKGSRTSAFNHKRGGKRSRKYKKKANKKTRRNSKKKQNKTKKKTKTKKKKNIKRKKYTR